MFASSQATPERIRRDIEDRSAFREKVSTSVELPFSIEMKRVLQLAAVEADGLGHAHIGTEHLLLAMLREATSATAALLTGYGLELEAARKLVSELVSEEGHVTDGTRAGAYVRVVPGDVGADAANLVDELVQLVSGLAAAPAGSEDAANLLSRALATLEQLRSHLRK